jgi:isoleucyl-tRNA synthetase
MDAVRDIVTEGLSQRAKAAIKVRQPLEKVTITNAPPALMSEFERGSVHNEEFYKNIIQEELNVKHVISRVAGHTDMLVEMDNVISAELKREGLMREVVRHVQQARKQADLEVDDRIQLELRTDSKSLNEVIKNEQLAKVIAAETLAASLNSSQIEGFETKVMVEGEQLQIKITKA